MNILPDELRLQIIEYTPPARDPDRYSSIGLSNYDILKRIHQYDPTFDYNEWNRLQRMKPIYQDRYNSDSKIDNIFDVEEKYKMTVSITDTIDNKYPQRSQILLDIARTLEIDPLLVDIRNCQSGRCIYVNHPSITYDDLYKARLYTNPYMETYFSSFNEERDTEEVIEMTNIPDPDHVQDAYIAMISYVPSSLEEVLAHTIMRSREKVSVMSLPSYPLFELINSVYFSIEYTDGDTLSIKADELYQDEIVAHFPSEYKDYIETDGYSIYFSDNTNIPPTLHMKNIVEELARIYRFQYPTKYLYCL